MRAGDVIRHKPSGEDWIVAAVSPDGLRIVACGWPETIAPIADCELVAAASEQEHQLTLNMVADGSDLRGRWASMNRSGVTVAPSPLSSGPSPLPQGGAA